MSIDARKILANVNPKFYFWVCDGQIIKNLQELAKALNKMNSNVYRYHVNKDKNDFKAWIKDVLNDQSLAREVAKCKTPASLAKVVKTRLDYLKKRRKKQLLEKKENKPVEKKIKKIAKPAKKAKKTPAKKKVKKTIKKVTKKKR